MKKVLLMSIMVLAIFIVAHGAGNPSKDLQTGIEKKSGVLIKKAVDELVSKNDDKSYNELVSALDSLGTSPEPEAYWLIVSGIARFTNKDVIAKITAFILSNKGKEIGRDLLRAFKSNSSSNIVSLFSTILEKGTYEMQKEAIYQLGFLYTKESLEVLFNFLKTLKPDNKELIKEVIYFIKNITNLDRGNYPESWIQWWNENKEKNVSEIIKPKIISGNIDKVTDYRPYTGVETLPQEKIIVVRNDKCDKHPRFDKNYDKIQDILTKLGIPHTVVGKSVFDTESYSLDDKWAIIFNCNFYKPHCCCPTCIEAGSKTGVRTVQCTGCSKHDAHETKLTDKTIQKIKWFVETGGYLFTEDLNIEEIIMRAFPKIIESTIYLPGQEVKILPAPGVALHPYLKYVFEAPPSNSIPKSPEEKSGETIPVKPGEFRVDTTWKIDDDSPDIKIIKKDVVTVLIVSPQLAKVNKNEGAVAVTWGYSQDKIFITGGGTGLSYAPGGRVLHVMSHFGKQKSKVDEFALQNLLLNFLSELNQHRPKKK